MFDLIFVSALFLLSVLAFVKGFMASFFSTFNWLSAILLSYFLTPFIAELISQNNAGIILNLVISAVTFFASLIILSIFTSSISKTLLSIVPESINKSLGFAFGFMKGYIIFAFFFVVVTSLYGGNYSIFPSTSLSDSENKDTESKGIKSQEDRFGPAWLTEAKSYKVLELGSEMLRPVALSAIDLFKNTASSNDMVKNLMQKNLEEKIEDINIDGNFQKVRQIQDIYKNPEDTMEKGYDTDEIEDMERLIETIE